MEEQHKDYHTAFCFSLHLMAEIGELLTKTEEGKNYNYLNPAEKYKSTIKVFGLPDLTEAFDKENLTKLKTAIEKFDAKLKQLLQNNGVDIVEYKSIDEFEKSLL